MSDVTAGPSALTAREIRRARARRLALRFVIWVVIPTFLGAIYYGCWASSQYDSVAVFTVRTDDLGAVSGEERGNGALNLSQEAAMLHRKIRSRTMLDLLAEKHGFIEHYRNSDVDWWSRLSKKAGHEESYRYFLEKVKVSTSGKAGWVTVTVRAFSGEAAQKFAQAIVTSAVEMLNETHASGRSDRIRIAEEEVAAAQTRLAEARQAVLALENGGTDVSRKEAAEHKLKSRATLETDLAAATADLRAALAAPNPATAKLTGLRDRIRSIELEIAKAANGGGTHDPRVDELIVRLEPALMELDLAQRGFETALRDRAFVRSERVRNTRHVVTISAPSLPDAPAYPRRGWGVLTVFVLAVVLMGIFTLLSAAVREHAKL